MGILVGKIQEMLGITTTPKPGQSLMASPAFLGEKPRRQPPHPPTRRNLVSSKPCSPCSSPLRPPRLSPQQPSVAVSLEVGSLGVLATTKRRPAQRPQLPPLRSVVDFLGAASSAAQVRRRQQRQQRQRRRQQLQPSAEVFWAEDFFARFISSLRTTFLFKVLQKF